MILGRESVPAVPIGRPLLGRILVRVPTWIGDNLMALPALRELTRLCPAAHIGVLTRSWTAQLSLVVSSPMRWSPCLMNG